MKDTRKDIAVDETELLRQLDYMQGIRKINDAFETETGKKKKFFSLAMGCQMNAHDSEKLEGMLDKMGYERTDEETDADFIIYNTCCVRENAEQKVYGKLGWLKHYKKDKPDTVIALCGCMMQQDSVIKTLRQKYRHVDIVFGTYNLYKLPELMNTRMESGDTIYDIWQEQEEIVEDLPSIRHFPYKAAVNIMFGCNNFCTYCIVPYVRGRERSREAEDIIAEVKKLAADGVKEIMLLGQNVNSYGKNLSEPVSFAKLLRMVNDVEGIERIRFMTSHPKDLSDELIEAMKDCPKVCKSLHLPVQAGSSEILRRMNRNYTKESYLETVGKIKEAMPDITLSTDIIVGFPGETEEDFQETLDVIRKVGYTTAYTFIYSKRTGTPAATMDNQVDEDLIKDRFDRMLNVLNPMIHELNEKMVGKIVHVLVEEPSKSNKDVLTGRADNYALVHFEGSKDLIGQIVPVRIIENKTFYFIAERVNGD
ncbi:tRNA (N6-isopentenyl adenosine(37)-C2)-methylthiotransferase MiaB [Anaerotignum propionicum]|uniref:tRNA-2-methylthio-N(6)-dimethylallyladenosine synthase n=1 Tax=Anaerotignum propionicum DSM 1682 TaxID=991789 RepID=A0A0X1U7E8_ANAPI|nr:tRNA (N6-isopentenyl adenosine(37)-C2)-methylthiotransferase MiaB [Anaerotignum propionicum]AMJ40867.1 tRNA-2-methylthio-N(6)-dimethylallyladenosine synthase [Anaerotignum propionicum DSM 1682]SHE75287.1 tRNA-2-methylthio-N6-dimethylallyladenosine synthase [[Clostridium] propionicum DSM 1682] [Anaerotignum propionicum DSM 1682]